MNSEYLIDKYCKYQNAKIYFDYSCILNQTVITNNKNKFYIMQLLKLYDKFIHYIRYGRIGEIGKTLYHIYNSEQYAIINFEKQFKKKTNNYWINKNNFIKINGKYFLTDINYDKSNNIIKNNIESRLNNRVQFLISIISDIEIINKTLIDLQINTKKLPLGKISENQIFHAKNILKQINSILNVFEVTY
jgi:predicted DNA-binding WGR domain protein